MSEQWRNDPATEKQKEKLCFFGCTWDEGVTKGQASDAISQCVQQFPEREAEWQNRPATQDQVEKLRQHGEGIPSGLTYAGAKELLVELDTEQGLAQQSHAGNYPLVDPARVLNEQAPSLPVPSLRRSIFGWISDKLAQRRMAKLERVRQRQEYIASIISGLKNGNAPPFSSSSFVLQKGERICWIEPGVLHEMKVVSRRYEGGSAGISFRVARGVRFNVGKQRGNLVSKSALAPVSDGELIITDKRLAFVGGQKSFATKLEKLIEVQPALYGMQFSEGGKSKPKVVKYHNKKNGDIVCEVLNYVLG